MKIQMFLKVSVLQSFANFTKNHLCWKTPALQALMTSNL